MASLKTRAATSSSSIPPTFITGAGIDKHAIEIRSKLHPFAQNVLEFWGLIGLVLSQLAKLIKEDAEAPLCFQSSSERLISL
ncbi:hypothetical protein L3X38_017566 [Prunus dulcis]|uniref:Uncharacterized protein n=1 Tax=Prunus dulcis TaxID=3755 RepID=A0AAD4W7D0_PRUDU|nr:hypothetical protein L3X38_017566 [Prunus dulcis]